MTTTRSSTYQSHGKMARRVPGTLPERSSGVPRCSQVAPCVDSLGVRLVFPSPGFLSAGPQPSGTCDPWVSTAEQAIAWGYPRPARRGFAAPCDHTQGVADAPSPGCCARQNSLKDREKQTASRLDAGAEQ